MCLADRGCVLLYLLRRTIHGLVFNALKMFMDMNQKLFDELSAKYKDERVKEKDALKKREDLWTGITKHAKRNPVVR
jgi:serine/threonine-protein phosphatase 2A regulatory subunit B'